jgi:glucose-1-phosphate thymidylyltransferase
VANPIRGLVLAGGTGTRLRPITHTSAKQLVPLANKPILFYGLESLARAGVNEVAMIVGDTREEVKAAVGDGSRFGMNVTYIHQEKPLGLAHCVLLARKLLGDSDFIMYLGDNFIRDGVDAFVQSFSERSDGTNAQILLAKVPDPHRFGVATLDSTGNVVSLVEKPKVPASDLALVGVYLFDPTIHEAVRSIAPSARGELEITDAIQWLISNGKSVKSHIVEGYWKDLGEPEALLEGNRLVLESLERRVEGEVDELSRIEGRVALEPGATVVRSIIRGPAIVGHGAVIKDSFIGPFTSVAAGCVIESSEVEHSIILNDSRISNIHRLEGSIIGKSAVVAKTERRPLANRLVVGDHSRIDLV